MEALFGDERVLYIQSNTETYLKKFNTMESKSNNISWNWCGFLFGPAWMIYRKLYGYAAMFFILPIFIDVILQVTCSNDLTYSSFYLIYHLIFALFGGLYSDYWYKMKIDSLMREGLQLQGEAKLKHLKKGGTSLFLLVIFIVISIIFKSINI